MMSEASVRRAERLPDAWSPQGRGRPGGSPDGEVGGQELHRLAWPPGDKVEERPCGKFAFTPVWLPYGAESEGAGSRRVVEADDRQVAGDVQAGPASAPQRPLGKPVGHAQEASWPRSPGQERGGLGGTLIDAVGGARLDWDRRPVDSGPDDRITVAATGAG